MKKPLLTEFKTLLSDRRGMAMMPALLLAGLCSVTQVNAADEAVSAVSPPATAMPVPGEQAAPTVKMEADLTATLQERDQLAATLERTRETLTDKEQSLSALSAQRDDLNEKLAAEQAARGKAEQALTLANTEIEKQGKANEQAGKELIENEQRVTALSAERDDLNEKLAAEQAARGKAEQALTAANTEIEKQGKANEQAGKKLIENGQRLAALSAERDDLLRKLADEKAALEKVDKALASVTEKRDQIAGTLAEAKESLMKSESQLKSASGEQQKLAHTLGQYRTTLSQTKEQLLEVVSDRDRLGEKLAESQNLVASLRASLGQSELAVGGLRKDIDALQATLPGSLGGDASLKSLQEPAGRMAAELMQISRALWRSPDDMELGRQRDEVAENLVRQQFLIASATGAAGVYQLRAEDTLSLVALRVYGDANHWPKLFETNTHILEDPDRVVPKMTLLIP